MIDKIIIRFSILNLNFNRSYMTQLSGRLHIFLHAEDVDPKLIKLTVRF